MHVRLFLYIFTLLLQIRRSIQFASWFVERSSSCYIDVRDTTEVVMNSFIVPYEQSSHPEVFIEIYDSAMNQIDVQVIDGKRVVYQNSLSETYTLKLATASNLPDLQYIMDVRVEPLLDDDQIQHLDGTEARFQAKFLSPARGCRDYRAHGRRGDKGLQLLVNLPPSVYESSFDPLEHHSVNIVSAWACGHEAITLTQSIHLMPNPVGLVSDKMNTQTQSDGNGQHVGGGTNKGQYTANRYLTGLIVMIVVGGTMVNAFLAMSRPRKWKNKRKL